MQIRPKELPRREEWDFRNREEIKNFKSIAPFDSLDSDEVWHCLIFEEARHGADVKPALESRQKLRELGVNTDSFDALLRNYWKCDPNGKVGIPPVNLWFYFLWPEWPQNPYLSISRAVRKERMVRMWSGSPPEGLQLVRLIDICEDFLDARAGKDIYEMRLHYWREDLELGEDAWTIPGRTPPYRDVKGSIAPREVAAFEIDFSLSNKTLGQLFHNWLNKRRKDKGYTAIERRGPASDTNPMRAQLCAIGAARLVAAGMTYREAHEYTKSISGKPLFSDKAAWSRAVKRVKGLVCMD